MSAKSVGINGRMNGLLNEGEFLARYKKRLAIVVPYRNRPRHLTAFIQRITNYFQRDKLDRNIPISIHVVEQQGDALFNAGKLRNSGYRLAAKTCDYVCFHDVDYLPIWTDYSWSEKPARLCWYGLRLRENREKFFGAVVLFDKCAFERVNGYPNAYWGWGPEDEELGFRCKTLTGGFDSRDGTYLALPHPHRGINARGVHTDEAKRTLALYKLRQSRLVELIEEDGLSGLQFETVKTMPLRMEGVIVPDAFHHLVDIGKPES